MSMTPEGTKLLTACADLIGHTGARGYTIQFVDVENADPATTVWIAFAQYGDGGCEVAAAVDPVKATLRLTMTLVDGGQCTHCRRPTVLDEDWATNDPSFYDQAGMCAYVYDPELGRFERACRRVIIARGGVR